MVEEAPGIYHPRPNYIFMEAARSNLDESESEDKLSRVSKFFLRFVTKVLYD